MPSPSFMRKSTLFALPMLALAGAFLESSGGTQQPAPAPAGTAAKPAVRDVILPITVRDKKGALVNDLSKNDVTLSQDGRPQTIKSLARESSQPLRVGLLVDTSRAVGGAMNEERKAATQFVSAVLPENSDAKDQAFLIHFDREVELLEDFTNSREKLNRELEDMGPTKQERYDNQGPETAGDDRGSARHGRNGTQLYDAIYLASDELMKSKDGRKILVLFSNGADRGSKETLNDAIDAADRANLAIYTIFFKGQQERSETEFPGQRRRPGMGGGWPGSGGGGGGRRDPEPTSASGVDGKKIMQQIATRTGGHAYEAKKPADLEAIYKLVDEEIRAQYLLTFTPDKADDEGGFHKVEVKAKKEDLFVSAPEGYYALEGKP
ncbi:VWA domain-containing protein [Acidobacteria bacterium AB60]|nr:VWA domain-containing protein [Acidobacteria bacterium AB60]